MIDLNAIFPEKWKCSLVDVRFYFYSTRLVEREPHRCYFLISLFSLSCSEGTQDSLEPQMALGQRPHAHIRHPPSKLPLWPPPLPASSPLPQSLVLAPEGLEDAGVRTCRERPPNGSLPVCPALYSLCSSFTPSPPNLTDTLGRGPGL